MHFLDPEFPVRLKLESIDPAVLETLDRLCERGRLMMPVGGRFDHIITLLGIGYAKIVDAAEHYSLVEPTTEGTTIALWRKHVKEERTQEGPPPTNLME